MNSELAALLMGLAAVLLLSGYRISRKKKLEHEWKRLQAEFLPEEENRNE